MTQFLHRDISELRSPILQTGTVRPTDFPEGRRLHLIQPGTRVPSPSPMEEEGLRVKGESHIPALTPETEQWPQERGPVSTWRDWP